MTDHLKVAVLMGGPSAEREVSFASAKPCAAALRAKGHEVLEIEVTKDLNALVKALTPKPDVVFNALHGQCGEDGRIQGVLDYMGLKYTHSGVLASAVAMDKPMAKRLFASAGLLCPEGRVCSRREVLAEDIMPRPYVVKPCAEGSSVGVIIVTEGGNQLAQLEKDWPFGEEVLVERFIGGRELTTAVMGEAALAVTELRPVSGFYDYEAKYTEGKTIHQVPAEVPDEIYQRCLAVALEAHKLLGCKGVSRADFRYDDTKGGVGELFLPEPQGEAQVEIQVGRQENRRHVQTRAPDDAPRRAQGADRRGRLAADRRTWLWRPVAPVRRRCRWLCRAQDRQHDGQPRPVHSRRAGRWPQSHSRGGCFGGAGGRARQGDLRRRSRGHARGAGGLALGQARRGAPSAA